MKVNPQTENGFLKIASGEKDNDIVMALVSANLTGMQWEVVMSVIRYTYGYGKKDSRITLGQFMQFTRRTRKGVCVAIRQLEERKILRVHRDKWETSYGFNKVFTDWKVVYTPTLVNASTLVNRGTLKVVNASTPELVNASTHTKEKKEKKDITATQLGSGEPKVKGRNKNVQQIIDVMGACFGNLDGSEEKNRRYAWLFFKKAMRVMQTKDEQAALDSCLKLIRAASKHPWWGSRITQVRDVFENAHKIANALKNPIGNTDRVAVIIPSPK